MADLVDFTDASDSDASDMGDTSGIADASDMADRVAGRVRQWRLPDKYLHDCRVISERNPIGLS